MEIIENEIEQINSFKDYMIAHPKLKDAVNEVFKLISHSSNYDDYQIINVIGPTGVGKTTLRIKLEKMLFDLYKDQMIQDTSFIPFISLESVAPDNGRFNWKDFYIRCLTKLSEPLIDKKVDYDNYNNKFKPIQKKLLSDRGGTAPELRHSLEKAIKNRSTRIIIIDEAQHIGKMASGRRTLDQLDTIKSLANMTNVIIILIGTYDLLQFVNLSGQLSRRSYEVHLQRYNYGNQTDLEIFRGIINQFQERIKGCLDLKIDLNDHKYEGFLLERSLGLVGILKKWLVRSLINAINEGGDSVKFKHLKESAYSSKKIIKIFNEINEGENYFMESKAEIMKLMNDLEIPDYSENNNTNIEEKKSRKNVGKRKPKRDKVGVALND